jgi:hypothetical protein
MSRMQHDAPQQYVQLHVAGHYESQLHQPHVPQQQVQQLHQGPPDYNTMPQVQPQHQYDTYNTYVHPTQPYTTIHTILKQSSFGASSLPLDNDFWQEATTKPSTLTGPPA